MVSTCPYASPLGGILLAADDIGLTGLWFDGQKYFAGSLPPEHTRQENISGFATPEYREALKLRQIWCEGTFAAQKRSHNLTRVLRRGLEAAEDHCLLSAVALNLKRMIKYKK